MKIPLFLLGLMVCVDYGSALTRDELKSELISQSRIIERVDSAFYVRFQSDFKNKKDLTWFYNFLLSDNDIYERALVLIDSYSETDSTISYSQTMYNMTLIRINYFDSVSDTLTRVVWVPKQK